MPIKPERFQPRTLVDAYCGAGGASRGYWNTGRFDRILGIDKNPQPNYPYEFIQGDVLEVLRGLIDSSEV